jgi:hypothetical protein
MTATHAPAEPRAATRAVSRPHDADERQADRAADAVARGGSVAGWSFSAPPGGGERVAVDDALATPGRPLDAATRDTMQTRFGYDFGAVRVHDGAVAARAAARIGAAAFAVDDQLVFGAGRAPSGRLLAHELAHVVQRARGGGAPGMVHRYTSYSAAEQSSGSSHGWRHPGAAPLRVSDDGQIAVEDNGWGEGSNKRAWTTPALVAGANATLSAQGSVANLRAKAGATSVSGTAPETGAGATLTEIEPFNTAGGPFRLASDCGTACRQITGSGPAGRDVAVMRSPADPGSRGTGGAIAGGILGLLAGAGLGIGLGSLLGPIGAIVGGIVGGIGGLIGGIFAGRALGRRDPQPARERYSSPQTYHGGSPTTPEQYSGELFQRELGGATREEALARYTALSASDRDAFDRRFGINAYARPDVGQGLTIGTEGAAPGFTRSGFTWNFHYAATVLASGEDVATLESAAGWDPLTGWTFNLYGPARKGQSFHEEQGATGTHGSNYSTFVVEPERLLDVRVNPPGATLRAASGAVSLAAGTRLRVIERRPDSGEYLARVVDGPAAGTEGFVAIGAVR